MPKIPGTCPTVSLALWYLRTHFLPFQDPELEAKRKAELEKIRSQKKKFKQKIQESIQKQKQLKKKLMKRRQMKKKEAAQATAWKPPHVYTAHCICIIPVIFVPANKLQATETTEVDSVYWFSLTRESASCDETSLQIRLFQICIYITCRLLFHESNLSLMMWWMNALRATESHLQWSLHMLELTVA